MFGMSREERRRLGEVETAARDARDLGNKSLAELAAHTAVCTERHTTINEKLTVLSGSLRWANRQGVLILLMVLGAILLEVARAKGLFG